MQQFSYSESKSYLIPECMKKATYQPIKQQTPVNQNSIERKSRQSSRTSPYIFLNQVQTNKTTNNHQINKMISIRSFSTEFTNIEQLDFTEMSQEFTSEPKYKLNFPMYVFEAQKQIIITPFLENSTTS